MKLRRLYCTALIPVVLATLPVAPLRAADPLKNDTTTEAAPLAAADAETLFRVGEAYKISTLWLYWKTYASQIPKRFDDFDALIKKAGAPAPVVADLDADRKRITPLPWTKTWDQWSDAEKKQWTDYGFNFDVWLKWINFKPFDKMFFFYLGRESMNAWYNIEKNINDGDATIADRTQTIRDCLTSIATLMTDTGYAHARATLNPEALAAMKQLQELHDAVEDPLNGAAITQEIVTKVGTAGRKLRDLTRAGNLLAK